MLSNMKESERTAQVLQYLDEIREQFESGHAIEHAYRPALKALMSNFDDIIAVNDPKHSEHGAPDFIFLKKSNNKIIHGYAEAKDIMAVLDKTEKSEQMKRYAGYANLFLTNYLEFRFFRNGEKYETISLGHIKDGKLYKIPEQGERLMCELEAFLDQTPESIRSGKRLAQIMGGKARRIRDNVAVYLEQGNERDQELVRMYDMMKQMLVHDLSKQQFADMYAQTLVYGLFVARYGDTTPDNFTRSEARDLVPASNPFLRHFFDHIVGPNFDTRLGYIVDELCEVFSVSDVQALVHKHLRIADDTTDAKDPIIHFYEDFLQEYDPAERKKMGAYYTPIPVVKYIVRQVDKILKKDFGIAKGLASNEFIQYQVEVGQDLRHDKRKRLQTKQTLTVPRVQVLDPAVGTATFLNETIKHVYQEFKGQEGMWPGYVNDNLLKRLHGFELMMAPYTIAHLKLGMTLRETGVENLRERLGVYLTNTLEEGVPQQPDLFSFGLAEAVSEESRLATEIKSEKPVMVVMGNPPYSASSSNRTKYANSLVDKYKVEPGGQQKLQEHKHWLNDDYVKFIAFAEDMIEKNGTGVVAMITNNGYLDNPTFRGMRWHLTKTFDKIYVLDLHGNAKKKEVAPDGSKDQNVFDIMQGVCIILAVKMTNNTSSATVSHADLWGSRIGKFEELASGSVNFQAVDIEDKNVLFSPQDTVGQDEYYNNIGVDELFLDGFLTGVVSGNDKVTLFDTEEQCKSFIDWCKKATDEQLLEAWGKFGRGQTAQKIREDVNDPAGKIVRISYRPFEVKYTYYTGSACGFLFWPRRKEIMGSMIPYFSISAEKDISFLADSSATPNTNYWNIGLVTTRLQKDNPGAFIFADGIIGHKTFNAYDSNSIFPLYTYHADGTRSTCFNSVRLSVLTRQLSGEPSPEDVLDYIYAVLHSPSYRTKYKEFLKIDFPRVPAPTQTEFDRLVPLGRQLRQLHLMKSPSVDDFVTTYPVAGDNVVEKPRYEGGNVYINDTQYFGGVPQLAWDFYIGGYQPAQKWLKDRKGCTLASEDITHYQRIIRILLETVKIMKQIG